MAEKNKPEDQDARTIGDKIREMFGMEVQKMEEIKSPEEAVKKIEEAGGKLPSVEHKRSKKKTKKTPKKKRTKKTY